MGTMSLIWAIFKSNMMSAMEYRLNFISEFGGMFLNDTIVVIFWNYFYSKFPVAKGFSIIDYMVMMAVVCSAVGLSRFIFGNVGKVSEWISSGGVDAYLIWPKPVLLHFIASRSAFHALGDIVFGVCLFFIARGADFVGFAFFILLVILAGAVFTGFELFFQSLAFWFGSSGSLADELRYSIILFTTYPFDVYSGFVKGVLFIIIPAAYISGIPVQLLAHFDPKALAIMFAAAIFFIALAWGTFYYGLRRYESGSSITIRT